ncbi:MAG: glycoside hydrolase [Deltaproteobacteria bacterium]|nr:glycoside hydrolase [Deltaproteobacteria bacterium]
MNGTIRRDHPTQRRTIYLVPHTHYDVVWAFNKEDYFLIFLSILRKAIQMIREDDFRFLIEQTFPLEMLENRDPELFAQVEEMIRRDKIEMVDAQYLMADPMSPGGEVLVREILYGKRYCREKFGVEVPVAWAADGFGLNAQLPQIYRKSGYRWLAFRRGLPKSIGTRVSEFYWEGLDGTKIPSHWMPLGYRAGLELDEWERSFAHLARLATTPGILMPCGSGGTIPQDDIPQRMKKWNETHDDVQMLITTPRHFFEAFDKFDKNLITFRGELYSDELESIFPDVASSRIRLRLAMRDCERELLIAEKSAALAMLRGRQYPDETLSEMWKKELFLAMHDVMPGCGIDEIYKEAWEYIEEMKKTLPRITRDSLRHLMPGTGRAAHIAVFNPNSWKVRNWVTVSIDLSKGWGRDPAIALGDREIPSEVLEVERWDDGSICRARVGFFAEVPALGCRTYAIVNKQKQSKRRVPRDDEIVESKHFRVQVDRKSGIATIYDRGGVRLISGNEIIIDEEIGDLYFHKSQLDKRIGSESGEGLHFGVFRPESLKIGRGPARTVITFQDSYYCLRWPYYLIEKFEPLLYRHKTVEVIKKLILYDDFPRIDFETQLNLLQSHVRIRLKFDTHMTAPRYSRQTQFGVIDLPVEKTLRSSHKTPSLSWISCQEQDRGLALLTQGVPINEIEGGVIYCTLLRSVSVLSADGISGPLIPTPEAQELGVHNYSYSVYPYSGDWREAQIFRRAFETSQPLRAIQINNRPDSDLSAAFEIEPDNLVLSALKKSEDGTGVVVRFFETKGSACKAIITVPDRIKAASVVNLIEDEEKKIKIKNNKLRIMVGPFEIVSLKLVT